MTGPEDPLADAAAVRVVSKLPEAAELAGKLPEGAKLARAGSADAEVLYHGTDLASARNIVQSGISKAAARDLGGGDFFWATTKIEDARLFGMANPRGSAEVGIVGIRVMGGIGAAEQAGIIERVGGGVYRVTDWRAFNRTTQFFMAETIP